MDGWMDGWVAGWLDGWMAFSLLNFGIIFVYPRHLRKCKGQKAAKQAFFFLLQKKPRNVL
jgi:hypothetical protein